MSRDAVLDRIFFDVLSKAKSELNDYEGTPIPASRFEPLWTDLRGDALRDNDFGGRRVDWEEGSNESEGFSSGSPEKRFSDMRSGDTFGLG